MNKKKIIIGIVIALVIALVVMSIWFAKQKALLDKICFKPAGLAIRKLGLKEADVTIKLLIKNMSSIDCYVTKQEYRVYVNEKEVSYIKSNKEQYVAPGTKSPISIDVKFNLSQATKQTLLEFATTGDVKIVMKGYAKIRKGVFAYKYPVDETFSMKEMMNAPPSEPC